MTKHHTPLTDELIKEGIPVHFDENIESDSKRY